MDDAASLSWADFKMVKVHPTRWKINPHPMCYYVVRIDSIERANPHVVVSRVRVCASGLCQRLLGAIASDVG